MKLRSMTAGLMAVLLLCVAAVSGVCSLRCELRRNVGVEQQRADMAMPVGHCHGTIGVAAKDRVSVGCAAVPCGYGDVSEAVADEGNRASLVVAQPSIVVERVVLQRLRCVCARWGEAQGPPRSGVGSGPLIVAWRV